MYRTRLIALSMTLLGLIAPARAAAGAGGQIEVYEADRAGAFPLVSAGGAARVVFDEQDHRVVAIAANCFAEDVERVTRAKPAVAHEVPGGGGGAGGGAVIIGSLDRSRIIRALVDAGKLDAADLKGQWESFRHAIVDGNLIIVGSDRRGTAYGAFELSRAIGVSPWSWWADVPPARRQALFISPAGARHGPPSVKYRGIFLNDEDWGLQPWAARTFEPEVGDIGPRTYARIFELLLRLKANYCWPAMHECTRAFNAHPRNKQVADDHAIVMGSSHCEQMLRNNVTEWPHDQHERWNPVTHLPAIAKYWEQRVSENAKFESTWTVGMRGIHDGGMPGGGTLDEKRDRLERIIALQRDLLARHVNPDPSRVPQIFCPYKEVLDIYRAGMKLPDDVTIVWPDDNHGHVRQLPDERERRRTGGHGIYYHLSYNGRPHDFLWLESVAPALIWHELTKVHEFGGQRLWVANVGDIKPIEAGTTLFLELAWKVDRYGPGVQKQFLGDFYTEQFGAQHGQAIAAVMDEYFRLCAIRKPETLGWNTVYPTKPIRDTEFSHEPPNDEAGRHVEAWLNLDRRASAIEPLLPEPARPAYFQLVHYPVAAAAAMAEKMLLAEKSRLLAARGDARANTFADRAEAAFARIGQLTQRYNEQLGGKWRGMMDARPRKLPVFDMPVVGRVTAAAEGHVISPTTSQASATSQPASSQASAPRQEMVVAMQASRFARAEKRGGGVGWITIDGLGRRGSAVALQPRAAAATLRDPDEIRDRAPVAEYALDAPPGGEATIIVEATPTQPITPAHELITAVSFDDAAPTIVRFEQSSEERDRVWQQNVLRNAMFAKVKLTVPQRARVLKLWGADPSVAVQRITIDFGGETGEGATYLGPRQ